MADILNLALPYFGLIFIGFACGKTRGLPESGLAWMNFFLLYVSLPALLFRIMSETPFSELNNPPFLIATTLATVSVFVLAMVAGRIIGDLSLRKATMAGAGRRLRKYRLYGPGAGAGGARRQGGGADRADLLLRQHFPVHDRAAVDGADRPRAHILPARGRRRRAADRAEPADHVGCCRGARCGASIFRCLSAVDKTLLFLQNAAAPTALFVLGVTVALRPFDRVPWEVPGVIAIKLLIHPLIVFGLMLLFGPFAQPWAATAVLMAALPPALNVFVIARQNNTWIEPASVAVLIGTFASVVTLTSVMWLIQSGRLAFP